MAKREQLSKQLLRAKPHGIPYKPSVRKCCCLCALNVRRGMRTEMSKVLDCPCNAFIDADLGHIAKGLLGCAAIQLSGG